MAMKIHLSIAMSLKWTIPNDSQNWQILITEEYLANLKLEF